MEGAPPDLYLDKLVESVKQVKGVQGMHHLHAWELDEQHRALEAHIVAAKDAAAELESIKREIKTRLAKDYDLHHSTLEFEFAESADNICDDSQIITDHKS